MTSVTRQGLVYYDQIIAGLIEETSDGAYVFRYDSKYLDDPKSRPVSLTLPLTDQPYESTILFAFFDGLIPEGWLLDLTVRNWKIQQNDRMGLLLEACEDCIGAVSVVNLAASQGPKSIGPRRKGSP